MTNLSSVSVEAVVRYAESKLGRELEIIEVSNESKTRLVVPKGTYTGKTVIGSYDDFDGIDYKLETGESILKDVVIFVFPSDVSNNRYSEKGVRNGVLVIAGKSGFTREDFLEMCTYE